MSTDEQVWFMASCLECGRADEQPHAFRDYQQRADWVGQHRIHTGHRVAVWIEPPR